MIDYAAISQGQPIVEYTAGLSVPDLVNLTNEMIDNMSELISGCIDDDVVFLPEDPEAHDPYAADESEMYLSWTLGHVIVHTTASAEEAAAKAQELARGVDYRQTRSRYETPWPDVTTIAQLRLRLQESRRMRLASLEMWPDKPHLGNVYTIANPKNTYARSGPIDIDAPARFVMGLVHDHSHLGQIANIVEQAHAFRIPFD